MEYETLGQQYSDTNPNLGIFIMSKKERMSQIYNNPALRIKILGALCMYQKEQDKTSADTALVLGTSLKSFPDKFKKRVYWASMLWHKGIISKIIFTGKSDHETGDTNQSEDAKEMSVSAFGVIPNAINSVGGDNTQQNVRLAKPLIGNNWSVLLISDARHLIRGITVAKDELKNQAVVYSCPVGNDFYIDPNDPRTIIELIKAVGYNRTSYKINPSLTQEQREYIKTAINKEIKYYEDLLKSQIWSVSQNSEEPFDIWLKHLPREYKIVV